VGKLIPRSLDLGEGRQRGCLDFEATGVEGTGDVVDNAGTGHAGPGNTVGGCKREGHAARLGGRLI